MIISLMSSHTLSVYDKKKEDHRLWLELRLKREEGGGGKREGKISLHSPH